jgi:hypothetical protein
MPSIKKCFRKEKPSSSKQYVYLLLKILILFIILRIFAWFKPLILIVIFEIFDFFKTVLRRCFPFIPVDLEFIFGVTAAYYYGFVYSVVIFILSVLNRILLSSIEIRHISKAMRHIPLFFIATFFRFYPFFWVAMILLAMNYMFKFLIETLTSQPIIEKVQYNMLNFLSATILFYFISILYYYIPFLA